MKDLNPRGVQRFPKKNFPIEERVRYQLDYEALLLWGGVIAYCAVVWWLIYQAVSWLGTQLLSAF